MRMLTWSRYECVTLAVLTLLSHILTTSSQLFTCSFETDDFCKMTQATNDAIDWIRTNKSTPSSDTGPKMAGDGAFYIFIETSDPVKNGDAAVITTPKFVYDGPACVRLSYHMYGTNIDGDPKGYLAVYTNKKTPIFRVEGEQQSKNVAPWKHIAEDITLTKNQKISIEAARGSGAFSDISVDNLQVIAGTCAEPITQATTTTTTPATTTTTTPLPTFEPTLTCPDPLEIKFETGKVTECRIRQATDDDFDWSITNTSTESEETGPAAAFLGNYYIYTEASTPRKEGETARLIVRPPITSGHICVHFMYFMYGYHIGKLEFYVLTKRRKQKMPWCMVGQQHFRGNEKWREGVVDVDLGETREMGFIGTRGDGYAGDIAVDDIKFVPGDCHVFPPGILWQCTFETEDNSATMCGIEQDQDDDFDWQINKGITPSDDTGPRKARSGLYYIFIETSDPRKKKDEAIIYLPVNVAGPVCMTFDVCLNGFHIGEFYLFARRRNQIINYWNRTGEWDQRFHAVAKTLTDLKTGDQIGFKGVRGSEYTGDISLDTIKIKSGECP